jgi:uncharacterized protein YchJ
MLDGHLRNPSYVPTVQQESDLATFEAIFGRVAWLGLEVNRHNNEAGLETVQII